MLNRRKALISGVGALLLASRALAQQSDTKRPRLGFLSVSGRNFPAYETFVQALKDVGYVDGQNIHLEARFAERHVDRLPGLTAELLALKVDILAVVGAVTMRAVRAATQSTPTVFSVVVDPVANGLVADANRPGGHATGTTNFDPGQAPAQFRLLKQIRPSLSRIAILGDAGVPDLLDRANAAAAEAEGMQPIMVRLRGPNENIEAVFESLVGQRAEAVIGLEVPAVGVHAKKIAALAVNSRMLLMLSSDSAEHGPMIAYGSSFLDAIQRMAGQVDRILKGAHPGDLPIEVVTRHRLVINQRVAREIGISVPSTVLARADRLVD